MATMTADKAATADNKNAVWIRAAKVKGYRVVTYSRRHRSGLYRVFATATHDRNCIFAGRYLASFYTNKEATAYAAKMANA